MTNSEPELDDLLQRYRAACPEVEPGANFMPELWQKIEARQSFGFAFQRLARTAAAACAGLCLLLLALNFASSPAGRYAAPSATYSDALIADTDLTEGLVPSPVTAVYSDAPHR